ncbi:uncharacterized protein LOC120359396 [Solenopsis invicta]|uniref:uncharacterized protein LOC120359396 n=1 Tax=Solenopsis invicta TaxID=13686 RepID=UPI00193D6C53|nr:uncharacterized protein LOC120359396 [Solenopsis invicta]
MNHVRMSSEFLRSRVNHLDGKRLVLESRTSEQSRRIMSWIKMSAYKSDLQRQCVRKDVIIEQAACATPQRRHYKESEGRNEATEDALEATAQLPTRRRRVRFSIEFLARKISQQKFHH